MSGSHDKIDSFLDDVCAGCKGVPADRRESLRDEVRTHLLTLIADYRSDGMSSGDAVAAATKMMGNPRSIGRACKVAWMKANQADSFVLAAGVAVAAVGACDWLARIVYGAIPASNYVAGGPLPPRVDLFWLLVVSVILPMVAGALTASTFPRRGMAATTVIVLGYCAISLPVQLVTFTGFIGVLDWMTLGRFFPWQHAHSLAELYRFVGLCCLLHAVVMLPIAIVAAGAGRRRQLRCE